MNPRDPVRLLETDSEASSELRELLDSARGDEPTPEQLTALAGRLGPLLTPPVGAPSSTPASSAGSTVTATGVKLKLLTGVALAVLAGGSFQAGRVFERARATAPSAPVVTERPRPLAEPRVDVPPPPPAPVDAPAAPAAPVMPTPSSRPRAPEHRPAAPTPAAASLDEELGLLESAYGALQRGDAAAALALAQGHAGRFPEGALAQEREVLAIDALMRLGRRSEAETRARTFQARYPTSTHWVRIQGLLSAPPP